MTMEIKVFEANTQNQQEAESEAVKSVGGGNEPILDQRPLAAPC